MWDSQTRIRQLTWFYPSPSCNDTKGINVNSYQRKVYTLHSSFWIWCNRPSRYYTQTYTDSHTQSEEVEGARDDPFWPREIPSLGLISRVSHSPVVVREWSSAQFFKNWSLVKLNSLWRHFEGLIISAGGRCNTWWVINLRILSTDNHTLVSQSQNLPSTQRNRCWGWGQKTGTGTGVLVPWNSGTRSWILGNSEKVSSPPIYDRNLSFYFLFQQEKFFIFYFIFNILYKIYKFIIDI